MVDIPENIEFRRSRIMISGNNNEVVLGAALRYDNLFVNLKGDGKRIYVGATKKIINGLKIVSIRGENQRVHIGKNLSLGGMEIQMNDGDEVCEIGDDCLFSWGIKIRTSDGHSVIDLLTDQAVNLPKDVRIGDHVWVGEDVHFLKGSVISADSVVGSCAVVTKAFPMTNCVIAGFPAVVVKTGITWDRKMPFEYNRTRQGRQ